MRKLKMRKAPGICGIVPEMLKAGGEVVIEWLTEVFNMVWNEGWLLVIGGMQYCTSLQEG